MYDSTNIWIQKTSKINTSKPFLRELKFDIRIEVFDLLLADDLESFASSKIFDSQLKMERFKVLLKLCVKFEILRQVTHHASRGASRNKKIQFVKMWSDIDSKWHCEARGRLDSWSASRNKKNWICQNMWRTLQIFVETISGKTQDFYLRVTIFCPPVKI